MAEVADRAARDAPLYALALEDSEALRSWFASLRDVRLEVTGRDLAELGLGVAARRRGPRRAPSPEAERRAGRPRVGARRRADLIAHRLTAARRSSAAARAAPSAVDRQVVDLAPDLLGDRRGDRVRVGGRRSPSGVRRGSAPAGGGRGSSARSGGASGKYRNGRRFAVSSIAVVSPPCTTARSQAARCRYRSWTYGADLQAAACGRDSERGSMRGPATTIIRSSGTSSLAPPGTPRSRAAAGRRRRPSRRR